MKNFIFVSLLMGSLTILSCTSEHNAITTVEAMKTVEMKNFDGALKSLMKAENRSTLEEKMRLGAQLNDRSLNILYNASNDFLVAHGRRLNVAENREQKEQVISQATKLYFERLKNVQNNLTN